jgi:hypothetical protein
VSDVGFGAVAGEVLTMGPTGARIWTTPPAGGGGWTDDGVVVRLTTITDTVVIGALVPVGGEKVRIVGDQRLEGCLVIANPAVPREYNLCVEAPGGALVARDVTAGTDRYSIETSGNLVMRGNYDFIPSADATGEVGTDAARFLRLRAATVVSGDLGFDDEICAKCLGSLEEGDELLLRVRRVELDARGKRLAYSVPVHRRCAA